MNTTFHTPGGPFSYELAYSILGRAPNTSASSTTGVDLVIAKLGYLATSVHFFKTTSFVYKLEVVLKK